MNQLEKRYRHVVEVDEKNRTLIIQRVFENGSVDLYIETKIPEITFDEDAAAFRKFARYLGENLLADSPAARRLLGF